MTEMYEHDYTPYQEEESALLNDAPPAPIFERKGGFALLLFVSLVLALLAGLISLAARWQQEVVVRDIVVDGNSLVSDKEVVDLLTYLKGEKLEQLDTAVITRQVMSLPYLKNVVVSKELNGQVRVSVTEREPMVKTFVGDRAMIIDREGYFLPWRKEVEEHFPTLLQVRGAKRITLARNGLMLLDRRDVEVISSILQALAETEYARMLIREIHLETNNLTWCLAIESPTRFIIGNDGHFNEKLKKFEIFWQKVITKKGFEVYGTVDLRFRDRIFTTNVVPSDSLQSASQQQ